MTAIPAWLDGNLVPVDKLEVHRRGLRHKAVSVFVMRGTETLIQRRALSKYHTPGLWANTCCTHPNWNEAPLDCALRRLDEELGISGLDLVHCGQVEYRAGVGGGMVEHELVDIYRAEARGELTVVANPDEVADTEWLDLAALIARTKDQPARFTPWLKIYLAQHLDLIADAAPMAEIRRREG